MQRTSFAAHECPIARSLQDVGEWWSILILRDVLDGFTRFDELQTNLGIAPAMLTRRLRALVDAGLLERRPYQERPVRHEYVSTERGRQFGAVITALAAWGNAPLAPDERHVVVVDTETGLEVDPVLVDRATGLPLDDPRFALTAGPAASPGMRERYDTAAARRAPR